MPVTFTTIGGYELALRTLGTSSAGKRTPSQPAASPAPPPHAVAGEAPQTSRPVEAMTAGRDHKQARPPGG